MDLILNNQLYVIYLISVMISVGIIKKNNYFSDFLVIISRYIKSKRLIVALTSSLTGVLPIPGRVTTSAGILDTMAPSGDDELSKRSRSKFGIVDYLSTHLYYLFSPLEKTIILPMAALSITYVELLFYTMPLLVISLGYVIYYIFGVLEEDDIILNNKNNIVNWKNFVLGAMPLFISIGILVYGIIPHVIFPILTLYYMAYSRTFNITVLNKYINWYLVATLIFVIIFSNVMKSYNDVMTLFLQNTNMNMETLLGIVVISSLAFGMSFLMGSSGKYAGIVAILVTLFGIKWLTWFMALEFAAYLISPAHKCTHIGRMYFGTTIKEYYKVLITWVLLLIMVGMISLIYL